MVFRLEEVFRDDANELQKSSIFEYAIPIELLNNSRQEDPVLGADGYQGGFPVVREKSGGKINFQEINLINWSWNGEKLPIFFKVIITWLEKKKRKIILSIIFVQVSLNLESS